MKRVIAIAAVGFAVTVGALDPCSKPVGPAAEVCKCECDKGIDGPPGPAGIQGDAGVDGKQGDPGIGIQGKQGPQGPDGESGPQGPEGDKGNTGPDGNEGPAGNPGPAGEDGFRGFPGFDGAPGPEGPPGPQGNQGKNGHNGDDGYNGDTGPDGPTGPKGDDGPTGVPGSQGPPGPDGPQGTHSLEGGGERHNNMQPFLTMSYIIALTGAFPSRTERAATTLASEPFIGEIRIFGGNFAPRGFVFCDGQLLTVNSNPSLFSIVGTTYGGDGRTTFGVPDLRGRVPIQQGLGAGLTNRILGSKFGQEFATLSENTMPNHNHI